MRGTTSRRFWTAASRPWPSSTSSRARSCRRYNRFDARQYLALSERFDVVTGGPESVRRVGWHRSPQWRADAVYLPAHPPLYGRAAEMIATIETLAERRWALWVPVVLHLSWEAADEWQGLVRWVDRVGRYAVPWESFYAAIEASR